MPGCPSNFRFYAGNGKWSVWTGASATHSRTSTLSAQTTIASYMWEKWVVSVENPNGHCTSSMADWCVASHFPTIIRYCWHPRLHGQVSSWTGEHLGCSEEGTSTSGRPKRGGHKQGNKVYHVKNAWQELGIVGPHSYRLIDLDGTKAWKSRYKNQFPVTGLVSGINKYVHSTWVPPGGRNLSASGSF